MDNNEKSSKILRRVKREDEDAGTYFEKMKTEMEAYSTYQQILDLTSEVTKFRGTWHKTKSTLKKVKKELMEKDAINFDEVWSQWKESDFDDKKLCTTETNCMYQKHMNRCPIFYKDTEQKLTEQFYNYSLDKISKPIDDFMYFINDTLNDFNPHLTILLDLVILSSKNCKPSDIQCRKHVNEWTTEEVKIYKTKFNLLKSNITETMNILRTVSDDLRKFKHDFKFELSRRKRNFKCCMQQSIDIFSCLHLEDKYDFKPFNLADKIPSIRFFRENVRTTKLYEMENLDSTTSNHLFELENDESTTSNDYLILEDAVNLESTTSNDYLITEEENLESTTSNDYYEDNFESTTINDIVYENQY